MGTDYTVAVDAAAFEMMPAARRSAVTRIALRILLSALALSVASAHAQALLFDQSEIRFYSKQLGVVVEGRFRKWSADVDFRGDQPERSRVSFSIDLGSVDFASDKAAAEMQRPGWFDSAQFPVATFVSTGVTALGGDRYEVVGRFTLKGATQVLLVPVQLARDASGNTVARGEFKLKRLQFLVGDGPWNDTSVVADDVLVRVRLTLAGNAPVR